MDLSGTIDFGSGSQPGNTGSMPSAPGTPNNAYHPTVPGNAGPPSPPRGPGYTENPNGSWRCDDGTVTCFTEDEEPEIEEEAEEPATPPAVVTLNDIASFVPPAPAVASEPDGIGAKNRPLNTVSTSAEQTIQGNLFGFPVAVGFTPAGFRYDWGDGTVTESRHGGSSWDTLGQAHFTPTATSHAYAAKGTYPLTVTALYTAVADFGAYGTRPVEGVIEATAPAQDVLIVEVHTALVQYDCIENPGGAGCPGAS